MRCRTMRSDADRRTPTQPSPQGGGLRSAIAPTPLLPYTQAVPRNPLLLAAIGIALLCIMDGLVKHLGQTYSIPEVTCGRYVAGLGFTLALWRARGALPFDRAMLRFHAVRGVIIALAGLGFFYAVKVLPLAEAITISFIAPLMVPFIARAFLREKFRPVSLAAAAIGFMGVIVAEWGQPLDLGSVRLWGVLSVLAGATFYAATLVLLRARAGSDGPARTGVLGSLFPALILSPFALATGATPALADLGTFVLMGLLGTAGMWCLALAYARAEAQQIAPLEFTALFWSALTGYVGFHEVPRAGLFAGAAIIVAAAVLAGADERRSRRALAA